MKIPLVRWNLLIQSVDIVSYEAKTKHYTVRIEARKQGDGSWQIFKIYYASDMNFTEEFYATNDEEMHRLLKQLMKEKLLSLEAIYEKKREQLKMPHIEIKRAFKEDNVEKWFFSIDHGPFENFFLLREYDALEIDIIVNEHYALYEQKIIEAIHKILSLDEVDLDIVEHIYFYRKHAQRTMKNETPNFLFNTMQSDFDEE